MISMSRAIERKVGKKAEFGDLIKVVLTDGNEYIGHLKDISKEKIVIKPINDYKTTVHKKDIDHVEIWVDNLYPDTEGSHCEQVILPSVDEVEEYLNYLTEKDGCNYFFLSHTPDLESSPFLCWVEEKGAICHRQGSSNTYLIIFKSEIL